MRTDKELLEFLSKWELKHFSPSFKSITYSTEEDYQLDLTCISHTGETYFQEVKSSRYQLIKHHNDFNPYFLVDNKENGLFRNFIWDTPPHQDNTITPNYLIGKYAYIISASTLPNLQELSDKSKFFKLRTNPNTLFLLLSLDGVLIFTHQQLINSFLGYGYMYCAHTQDFYNKTKSYELKALIDLSCGSYFQFSEQDKTELFTILHK